MATMHAQGARGGMGVVDRPPPRRRPAARARRLALQRRRPLRRLRDEALAP